jgi:hypothetical protein
MDLLSKPGWLRATLTIASHRASQNNHNDTRLVRHATILLLVTPIRLLSALLALLLLSLRLAGSDNLLVRVESCIRTMHIHNWCVTERLFADTGTAALIFAPRW